MGLILIGDDIMASIKFYFKEDGRLSWTYVRLVWAAGLGSDAKAQIRRRRLRAAESGFGNLVTPAAISQLEIPRPARIRPLERCSIHGRMPRRSNLTGSHVHVAVQDRCHTGCTGCTGRRRTVIVGLVTDTAGAVSWRCCTSSLSTL